jgi:hypothetical protein
MNFPRERLRKMFVTQYLSGIYTGATAYVTIWLAASTYQLYKEQLRTPTLKKIEK